MERRVVITGMGIWSCIGTTLDEGELSFFDAGSFDMNLSLQRDL